MKLRPYQDALLAEVYRAWAFVPNVLAVLPTGGGKTVIYCHCVRWHQGASVVIAHRHELVSQTSLTLARNGVRHRLIGPPSLVKQCVSLHMEELGQSYYHPASPCAAAGVDTLVRMKPEPWLSQVTLGIGDEGHHFLKLNKWGKATAMFPNARWLTVTATPQRADGKGLGRDSAGIIDWMVVGPTMRQLINDGYLTDYRIFAPPSDLDLSTVPTAAGGDFSPEPLRKAVHGSHITGDIVQHYKRLAGGKLGVTFAVDVEAAREITLAYKREGVPAELVTAETPAAARSMILRKFSRGDFKQLVNVDLFGEGFDLPALECVSFGRPTQSFAVYAQQFGRSLRLMIDAKYATGWDEYSSDVRRDIISQSAKRRAVIIDHVGNVHRHSLPDAPRIWSLAGRSARVRGVMAGMVKTCAACLCCYEAYLLACPDCGTQPVPQGRSIPEHVDGDLSELTPEALARLRGEIDTPIWYPQGASNALKSVMNYQHEQRQDEQERLRSVMMDWGGRWTYGTGGSLQEAWRRFYIKFGIDVLSAQALPRADAETLRGQIEADLNQ